MRFQSMYTAALAASASAMVLAMPAQADVVESEERAASSGFVTRDSTVVDATLRETWLMLIAPDKWWNSSHTFSGDAANMMLTPQAGGCFCERIPADDTAQKIGLAGSVEHMNVLLSIPDAALRMRGSLGPLQSEPVNGILTVTLAEVDEGTKITFEYAVGGYMRFDTATISKAVDAVMSEQLSGLSKQLGPIDPIEDDAKAEDADDADAEAASSTSDEASDDAPEEPSEEAPDDAEEAEKKVSVSDAFGDFKLEDQ